MPQLKNFVAVDWRAGEDKSIFFSKTPTLTPASTSRTIGLLMDIPLRPNGTTGMTSTPHAQDLRFGFTTTSLSLKMRGDSDILWLFYHDGDNPWCANTIRTRTR